MINCLLKLVRVFATLESQAFLLSEGKIIKMDLFNVVKVHKITLTEEQNNVGKHSLDCHHGSVSKTKGVSLTANGTKWNRIVFNTRTHNIDRTWTYKQ